ncbi:MAG TPA: MBL fold metallo-hydrolase [Anaerolineaceae bacterium]|nr:MBL fold metallo-hydrolase [Anaerolineaceae bacterium]
MQLKLTVLVLGPIQNNAFFLIDEETRDCVIVDPSFDIEKQLKYIAENKLNLKQIWITHGHFDHFIGAPALSSAIQPRPLFAMNRVSYDYAGSQDLKHRYGQGIDKLPSLDLCVSQGDLLSISQESPEQIIEVREVPGHCPGSVIFYCQKGNFAIVGDAIFRGSIGRTDLEGGDEALLLRSICEQIFTLPPETVLFPGHGPQTTVAFEKGNNPFFE